MSKKANAPKDDKSVPDVSQEAMKRLADLENQLLPGESAGTTQDLSGMAQQALEMLASLEGDLLQTVSLPDDSGEPVDESALWDSLAELEVDLLYDELEGTAEGMLVEAAPTELVEAVGEDGIASEPELGLADDLAELEAETLQTAVSADPTSDSVQELEEEILYEAETAVDIEDQELLTAEQELFDTEPEADEMPSLAEINDDGETVADDQLVEGELEESIATVVENAFATELEQEDTDLATDEEEAALEIEADDWGALADMEAELLTDLEDEATPISLAESEAEQLADLSTLETDLLLPDAAEMAAEEVDEVLETSPSTVEPDLLTVEFDGEDNQFLDELIAAIDADLSTGTAVESIIDLAPAKTGDSYTWEQHVIFTLSGNKYAVPANNIREVGDINYITPVPNVPDWLLGITNLRGDILSLVHLGIFLGLNKTGSDHFLNATEIEMMVVQSEQDATAITTGIIVDEVSDIRDLALERIRIPTAPIDSQLGTYMRGVYEENGQMYILLDLERLLMSPEMWQFEAI